MKRTLRHVALWVTLSSLTISGVVVGISYKVYSDMVHRVVYKPERLEKIKQEQARLHEVDHARDVSFTTADGQIIAGTLLLRPTAQRVVLICHGHKSAKEMMRPLINMFPDDTVFIFDFRAHGQSTGDIVSFGYYEYQDVLGALKYVQNMSETKGLPVVGVGVSMGAASLIHAVSHGASFQALILDSSFACMESQVRDSFESRTRLPPFPFMYLVWWWFERQTGFDARNFNLCSDIALVRCPLFIIHSRDDSIVPFSQAELLVSCILAPKKIWFIDRAFHGRACKEHGDEYKLRVHEFLASAGV